MLLSTWLHKRPRRPIHPASLGIFEACGPGRSKMPSFVRIGDTFVLKRCVYYHGQGWRRKEGKTQKRPVYPWPRILRYLRPGAAWSQGKYDYLRVLNVYAWQWEWRLDWKDIHCVILYCTIYVVTHVYFNNRITVTPAYITGSVASE